VQLAAADLQRANVLWLPTVFWGADYFRHDGQVQDAPGNVFTTSKSSLMFGMGPVAVFAFSDAIFQPLAQRQIVRARRADLAAATNDTLLAVAQAYFDVQQRRGEVAADADVVFRLDALVKRIRDLSPRLTDELDVLRADTELERRRQTLRLARERWQVASAELMRLLRLPASALVQPLEPPHLQVTLVPGNCPADELIELALFGRPELAAQRALVEAALARWRQEKWRPWTPSLFLRGASTPVTGMMAAGVFGGGMNSRLGDFSWRSDWDMQLLWEWQNLGLGNAARIRASRTEHQITQFQQVRLQDLVAAEVVQARAQVRGAADRVALAEKEVRSAVGSAARNVEGLGQTQGTGKLLLLTIRPQEAVAAVQALAAAYEDYYGAVGDYNRGQFRLYRALGNPAERLADPRCLGAGPSVAPPATAQPETIVLPPITLPAPANLSSNPRRYDR
jgi:outer membrane protein TolC